MKENHDRKDEPSFLEMTILIIMCFALAMWFSGCFQFIETIIGE